MKENKTMVRVFLALVLALGLSVSASAQTYLSSTTNTTAITASQTTFALGSVTGLASGAGLYINREYMTVRSVSGLNVTVLRGQSGTPAVPHGASQTVILIPLAAVGTVVTPTDPTQVTGVGTCTVTDWAYLPVINVINGNVWLCRYTAAAQSARVWAATNQTLITYNSLLLNLQ